MAGRAGPGTGPPVDPPLSLDLLRSDQADRHQVGGVDPLVRERDPAGLGDHVAHRNRPAMLDQRDGRRGALWDRVTEVPDRVVVEDVPVLELGGPCDGASFGSLFAAFPESDERSDDRAEPLRLLLFEIALL